MLFAIRANAVGFDLIVLKKVTINTHQHTSNLILARSWGMIIATHDVIGESNILGAEAEYSVDNPNIDQAETGFINVSVATPILKKTGVGGFHLTPFVEFLEPGETHVFKSPFYLVRFAWPNGFEGSATIQASIRMGLHVARYETLVDFVSRPEENWLIRRDEAQRISAQAPPFLPDDVFDADDLVVLFPPIPTPACDGPEPDPVGCTTLCKPCKRYHCEQGEWVAREEIPDELCRSKTAGAPYGSKKGESRDPVVACPRTAENVCPTECDLCW